MYIWPIVLILIICYYQDNPTLAKQLGEPDGSEQKFFRIWAIPAKIDFLRKQGGCTASASGSGKPRATGQHPRPNDFV